MTGRPLPAPSSVTVAVLNGSGVTNQATDTGNALAAFGFKIGTLGDTESVGSPAETVVTYAAQSDEAAAELVARSLSGLVVMAEGPTTAGSQVTVTTGTDFSVNSPHSTAPTAPTSASGPTGTSAQSLAAPTPAVTKLQPWDPRSCTPSGGEGT